MKTYKPLGVAFGKQGNRRQYFSNIKDVATEADD